MSVAEMLAWAATRCWQEGGQEQLERGGWCGGPWTGIHEQPDELDYYYYCEAHIKGRPKSGFIATAGGTVLERFDTEQTSAQERARPDSACCVYVICWTSAVAEEVAARRGPLLLLLSAASRVRDVCFPLTGAWKRRAQRMVALSQASRRFSSSRDQPASTHHRAALVRRHVLVAATHIRVCSSQDALSPPPAVSSPPSPPPPLLKRCLSALASLSTSHQSGTNDDVALSSCLD